MNPDVTATIPKVDGFAIASCNVNMNLYKGLLFNLKVENILNSEYYTPGVRSANGEKYNATIKQPGFNFMTGFNYTF